MSKLNSSHTSWRNEKPSLPKLVRSPNLPKSRLLKSHFYNCFFDLRSNSALRYRLPAANLPKGLHAPGFIQPLEATEAITGVTPNPTGLRVALVLTPALSTIRILKHPLLWILEEDLPRKGSLAGRQNRPRQGSHRHSRLLPQDRQAQVL